MLNFPCNILSCISIVCIVLTMYYALKYKNIKSELENANINISKLELIINKQNDEIERYKIDLEAYSKTVEEKTSAIDQAISKKIDNAKKTLAKSPNKELDLINEVLDNFSNKQ